MKKVFHKSHQLKDSKVLENFDKCEVAIVSWGHFDDYVKIKSNKDRPFVNALPLRANEQVNDTYYFLH